MLRFQTPSSCACLEWWLWNSADDTFFNYRWSPPWKMFLTTVLRTPQWWWQMWYTSTRVSVGSSGTTKASSDRLSFQNMNKYSRTRFSSPTGGFSTWIQRWTPPPPPKKILLPRQCMSASIQYQSNNFFAAENQWHLVKSHFLTSHFRKSARPIFHGTYLTHYLPT